MQPSHILSPQASASGRVDDGLQNLPPSPLLPRWLAALPPWLRKGAAPAYCCLLADPRSWLRTPQPSHMPRQSVVVLMARAQLRTCMHDGKGCDGRTSITPLGMQCICVVCHALPLPCMPSARPTRMSNYAAYAAFVLLDRLSTIHTLSTAADPRLPGAAGLLDVVRWHCASIKHDVFQSRCPDR